MTSRTFCRVRRCWLDSGYTHCRVARRSFLLNFTHLLREDGLGTTTSDFNSLMVHTRRSSWHQGGGRVAQTPRTCPKASRMHPLACKNRLVRQMSRPHHHHHRHPLPPLPSLSRLPFSSLTTSSLPLPPSLPPSLPWNEIKALSLSLFLGLAFVLHQVPGAGLCSAPNRNCWAVATRSP